MIQHGDAGMDLWPFDVRRFGAVQAQGRYLEERAIEAYGSYYKIHWPAEEAHAGRGLRRSPLHAILHDRGAVFGSKLGWERPNWFATDGGDSVELGSFEGRPGWFDAVGAEVKAIRERAALIDQSSFSKFEIAGPGAEAALQRIAANDLSGPPGRAVYTQLCNEKGRHRADVTFVQCDKDRFLSSPGSGFGVHDAHWIARHLPARRDHARGDHSYAPSTCAGRGARHPAVGHRRRRLPTPTSRSGRAPHRGRRRARPCRARR